MEKFFTNMQHTNWTSGITAGEEKERQRQTDRGRGGDFSFQSG
jgi:hypothetical protein